MAKAESLTKFPASESSFHSFQPLPLKAPALGKGPHPLHHVPVPHNVSSTKVNQSKNISGPPIITGYTQLSGFKALCEIQSLLKEAMIMMKVMIAANSY